MAGILPLGPSGVRDYGHLLGVELGRVGYEVEEHWRICDGRRVGASLAASVGFLDWAAHRSQHHPVVWHYSAMVYGLRGIPLPGVLFGLVLRARHVPLVTILHEPAYPWGRRGWRGRLQALTQWSVLPLVVATSHSVVVTTQNRARRLRQLPTPLRRPVQVIPVFSTLGVPPDTQRSDSSAAAAIIGVMCYSGDGARPDIAIAALGLLDDVRARMILLGAPGPGSADVIRWMELAERAGLGDRLEVSGVLGTDELSRRLMACDIVLLPNDEGPSGRRTTLAAALARGLAVLALDGPDRWDDLVSAGAIRVVPPEPRALAASLADLLTRPRERRELGARGRSFYERHMSLEKVTAAIAQLLDQAASRPGTGGSTGPARQTPRRVPPPQRHDQHRLPVPGADPAADHPPDATPGSASLDVAVSIVSHENRDLLRRCLSSLPAACQSLRWHATVVDNRSGDGSAAMVRDEFPGVTLLVNELRQGFGANQNQILRGVIENRSARYVLILNDDVVLEPDSVVGLVREMDIDPRLGALGPLVLDGTGNVQPSFLEFPTPYREVVGSVTVRTDDYGWQRPPAGGGWLAGCCLLVRTSALAEAGPFDERFFLFYEDTDLCLRLSEAEWPSAVCEDVRVIHYAHSSISRPDLAPLTDRYLEQSRHRYFRKHFGPVTATAVSSMVRLGFVARALKAIVDWLVFGRAADRILAGHLFSLARYDPRAPFITHLGSAN